jgi:O-antigen/teichoic acid export membrane protein
MQMSFYKQAEPTATAVYDGAPFPLASARAPAPSRPVATAVILALLNQVVSSGSNFVLGALLVRRLTDEGFGAWGLAFSALLLALNFAEALVLTPMVVGIAQAHEEQVKGYVGTVFAGACVVAAVGALLVTVGTAAVFHSTWSGPVVGLAAACGLASFSFVVKDAVIRICFALRRERMALLVNVTFGVTLLALVASPALHVASPTRALLAYFAAGGAASVAGVGLLQLAPAEILVNPLQELSRLFKEGRCYLGASLAYWLRVQAPTLVTTWALGLASVGVLAAGRLLLSPPIMVNPALSQIALPRLSRLAATSDGTARFDRGVVLLAAGLFTLSIVYSAVLWWGFGPVTRIILGPERGVSKAIAGAWCLFTLTNGVRCAIEIGLKALRKAKYVLMVNLAAACVVFPACAVAVRFLGVPGVVLGGALTELLLAGAMLVSGRRPARHFAAAREAS